MVKIASVIPDDVVDPNYTQNASCQYCSTESIAYFRIPITVQSSALTLCSGTPPDATADQE